MPFCPMCHTCYALADNHRCQEPEPPKIGQVPYFKEAAERKRFKRGINGVKDMEGADGAGQVRKVPPQDV